MRVTINGRTYTGWAAAIRAPFVLAIFLLIALVVTSPCVAVGFALARLVQ